MNEINGPSTVRPDGLLSIIAQPGRHPPLWVAVREKQNQLVVNEARLIDVHLRALPSQPDVEATTAISHSRLADLLDPSIDGRLIRAPERVVERGEIKPQRAASCAARTDGAPMTTPACRYIPIKALYANALAHPARVSQSAPLVQAGWRMSFPQITSSSISGSSARSATIFLSRLFSLGAALEPTALAPDSSAFRRRIMPGSRPPVRVRWVYCPPDCSLILHSPVGIGRLADHRLATTLGHRRTFFALFQSERLRKPRSPHRSRLLSQARKVSLNFQFQTCRSSWARPR